MTSESDHGLKNLFGSVPDEASQTPAARPAAPKRDASPEPAPSDTPPGREERHGLAGFDTPAAAAPPPRSPAPAAPTSDPAPDQGAPGILGVPQAPPVTASQAVPEPAPLAAAPTVPAGSVASGPGPALSVVLVAETATEAGRTIDALRRQTAARGTEVILVAQDADPLSPGDLAGLSVVVPAPGETYGARAARGVAAARGDLVALLDPYVFPAGDWAEQVAHHRHDRFAALGSALGNANPRSRHSWSHMLLEYGDWREGTDGTPRHLPARNLVFRRDALEDRDDLAALLDREGALTAALVQDGLPLAQEPSARLAVLNPSRLGETLRARYAAGRLDAARWREGMKAPRRIARAGRALLGGYGRYKRDRAKLFSGDAAVSPKQHGSAVLLALLSEGAGRAMGFLAGPGQAARVREELMRDRFATLNKTDRRQFGAKT